tara:strand:+ start:81 stop:1394 length:1314 start_codon:yes stop_codon:yes gene_type:complete
MSDIKTDRTEINICSDESVLEHNRVAYTESTDKGLVVRRQHTTINAPHTIYTVSTGSDFQPIIPEPIDLTIRVSDADYIDGKSSWLYFDLLSNKSGKPNFSYGVGSALNWIAGIKVIAPDGQVIEDLTKTNLYMSFRDRYTKSSGYFKAEDESVGELKGYGLQVQDSGFACPLNELIPLFNYDGLLPSNLVNKMRIVITMTPPHELMSSNITTVTADAGYAILNTRLMLDTLTMDPVLQKVINSKPFVIEYTSYKTQTKAYDGIELRMPFQYSVSRAKKAFCVIQRPTTLTDPESIEKKKLTTDFVAGEFTMSLADYRWRIGNRFQPDLPIKTKIDAFAHALTCWNRLSTNGGNLQLSPTSFDNYHSCLCVNLRRAGGGTPLNNGNELTLELTHGPVAGAIPRNAYMFVEYVKKLVIDPVTPMEQLQGLWNRVSILE